MKKMFSLVLCVMLVVSMLPIGAVAQEMAAESLLEGGLLIPGGGENPAEEETPVEEVPLEEELPQVEETPTVEEGPAEEETPVEEEVPEAEEETAALEEVPAEDGNGAMQCGFVYVNPLYEGVIDEEKLIPQTWAVPLDGASSYYTSVAKAAALVRQQMVQRNEVIQFSYKATLYDFEEEAPALVNQILEQALAHTGVPTEGDYLQFQLGGAYMDIGAEYSGTTYYLSVTLYMSYYTTAEQEAMVDELVDLVLEEFAFTKADTDYRKLMMIYAFICAYVDYDYTHVNDADYLPQYTAYGALVNQQAVCQGYAVLLYRLALEAGIDVRVIAGDCGGGHAWNIVRLGDYYYNLDATWDDEILTAYGDTRYFLVGSGNFTDHTPGYYEGLEVYNSGSAFWADYPVDAADFDWYSAVELIGDANYDGYVNVTDAEEILAYVNGLESVLDLGYAYMVNAAEVTGDGVIDSRDAAQILRFAAGLTSIYDTF